MKQIYAIVLDGHGAHEPEAIDSVWTNKKSAKARAEKLNEEYKVLRGSYARGDECRVETWVLNKFREGYALN